MPPMTLDTAGPRSENRGPDQLRSIRFQNHIAPHATGSTLIEWGQTRVVCGVTIEENVPRWMKEQKKEGTREGMQEGKKAWRK